jgi:hypothetical protein
MGEWWIYLLIFVFGYVTHKTFYFLRATRLSLMLVKCSAVIYLSAMAKALEYLTYSHQTTRKRMLEESAPRTQINSFRDRFDDDITTFKTRSIDVFRELHPPFFRTMIEFEEWNPAMQHLAKHKEAALVFWERSRD